MFVYCLNNPVDKFDPAGNRPVNIEERDYRLVGAGLQCEIDVGSYEVGLEIIVYTDDLVCGGEDPVVSIYLYEGAYADLDDIKKGTNFAKTIEKLTLAVTTNMVEEQNAEALLIALQTAVFEDVSVSGSVVVIFGNEEFQNTQSYAGPFTTYSGTIKHLKASLSTSSSCFTIALGGSSDRWGASFGQSNYTQIY